MITITRIFEFAAAHYLPYYKGNCNKLHGHTYRLEITAAGTILKEGPMKGMILDFGILKEIVKEVILQHFDHSNLNNEFDNPTAEIMVKNIAETLSFAFNTVEITKVRLWETPTSYATWKRD